MEKTQFTRKPVMEVNGVNMKVGDSVEVKGIIDPDAFDFAINLGNDYSNLALHFNPRFAGGVIAINSRKSGDWQNEQIENDFPFEKGADCQFSITFHESGFEIKLSTGSVLKFPNRPCVDRIPYIFVTGDVRVKSLKFDDLTISLSGGQ